MSSQPVVLATHRMGPRLLEEVLVVLRDLAYEPQNFDSGTTTGIVVTGLAAGDRSLPPELLKVLSRSAQASLVVISDDRLTRPVIVTGDGRVVLMDGPDIPDFGGRLRAVLAGLKSRAPGLIEPRERLRARWWLAELSRPGQAAVFEDANSGVLGVVALTDNPVRLPKPFEILPLLTGAPDHVEEELLHAVGPDAAVVHLRPNAQSWAFFWPEPRGVLALFSPLRVPSRFDVSTAMTSAQAKYIETSAHPGDVLLALSKQSFTLGAPVFPRDGGPRLLSILEQALIDEGVQAEGLIVEVRP